MQDTKKQAKVIIDGADYGKPHFKVLQADYNDIYGDIDVGLTAGIYLVDTTQPAGGDIKKIGDTLDDAILAIAQYL